MVVTQYRETCAFLALGVLLLQGLAIAQADEPANEAAAPAATAGAESPAAQPEAKVEPAPPAAAQVAAAETPASTAAVASDPTKSVRLDFQGQQWLPVLEWLAKVRSLNLDWQTLPDGTVNLASAKEYSVAEAEDLINMQLLARGFTLLQHGEVLRVSPLKNLDVTLVPRVKAEDLGSLQRHQFVRVTFPLDWMIAEEAAVEFKPLISPHGQLFPMDSSNRLEAIDAVVNLRELYRLLTQAEADEGRRERVAEFRMEHRKASDVAAKVRQLLGLPYDEPATSAATQNQLDIEKVKFQSEAVKQLGTNAKPLLADKGAVHLVVNDMENSILVSGRPDKIELARQAIKALDKPEPVPESSWETLNRVKIYEVSGYDPITISQLMAALQQRGNIRKETQIQYEAAYNRLVVVASAQDHLTIERIIEGFRTERRRAEVIPLATIDAQYATKAIQLVLKNPTRPAMAPGLASEGQFQIEPDTKHNRLLLWGTPAEAAEVREFLTRLGETFSGEKPESKMHVVRLRGAKKAEILQRLKRAWDEIGDAPLVIESSENGVPDPAVPAPKPVDPPTPASDTKENSQPAADRSASITAQFASQTQPAPTADAAAPAAAAATPAAPEVTPQPAPAAAPVAGAPTQSPVHIMTDEEGDEMIILSRDPAAAETAKQLVEQIVPEVPEVEVITLKHAQAAQVKFQLDALLGTSQLAATTSLDTSKKVTIEADSRINRLMIQHASAKQLDLITELIPILDQPTQEDERLVRQQRIYRAQRKRASEIAEVVKEVYRDVLSTNDKVFDARISNQPFGYNRAMAATSKSPEYQGLLSVGADDEGNLVVLSAPAYLMDEVYQLVERIDATGAGESMVVVPVSRAAHTTLSEALGRILVRQPAN